MRICPYTETKNNEETVCLKLNKDLCQCPDVENYKEEIELKVICTGAELLENYPKQPADVVVCSNRKCIFWTNEGDYGAKGDYCNLWAQMDLKEIPKKGDTISIRLTK